LENSRKGTGPAGEGGSISESEKWGGKWWRRVNMVHILCTHVCKWKNDTWWNYPKNGGREVWRQIVERVHSSTIYLTYCKDFCKCHNVPTPSTTNKKN
jgi:hypothetical protein